MDFEILRVLPVGVWYLEREVNCVASCARRWMYDPETYKAETAARLDLMEKYMEYFFGMFPYLSPGAFSRAIGHAKAGCFDDSVGPASVAGLAIEASEKARNALTVARYVEERESRALQAAA